MQVCDKLKTLERISLERLLVFHLSQCSIGISKQLTLHLIISVHILYRLSIPYTLRPKFKTSTQHIPPSKLLRALALAKSYPNHYLLCHSTPKPLLKKSRKLTAQQTPFDPNPNTIRAKTNDNQVIVW